MAHGILADFQVHIGELRGKGTAKRKLRVAQTGRYVLCTNVIHCTTAFIEDKLVKVDFLLPLAESQVHIVTNKNRQRP